MLIKYGFAQPTPTMNEKNEVTSKITIKNKQRLRIINMEERPISLDGINRRAGGRPAHSIRLKNMKRCGVAANKASGSATVVAGSNAAGEPIPVTLMLQSEAQKENIEIPARCYDGMPIVFGKFGNKREVPLYPIIMANEKGGMNNEEFKKYIVELVTILYPDAADIP